MIVECAVNRLSQTPYSLNQTVLATTDDGEFDLVVGREYVVYAIGQRYGLEWLYVLRSGETIPWPFPSAAFVTTESSVPGRWDYHISHDNKGGSWSTLSYGEWANDPTYYDRLVDRDPVALNRFQQERLVLALGESTSSVSVRPEIIGMYDIGQNDLFVLEREIVLLNSDRLVARLCAEELVDELIFEQGDPWVVFSKGTRRRLYVYDTSLRFEDPDTDADFDLS